MSLPSLLDVVVVVALIIPGFVAFAFAGFLGVIERKLPEFETIIWSLLFSLVIYGIFSFATGIVDFEALRDNIFRPGYLAIMIVDTLFVGSVIGLFWHLVVNEGERPMLGDPWDIFFDSLRHDGRDLVVFTKDGKEFRGWVGETGKEDNRLELLLLNPELVIRDPVKWTILAEISYGDQILFTDKDVMRVAMLEERE